MLDFMKATRSFLTNSYRSHQNYSPRAISNRFRRVTFGDLLYCPHKLTEDFNLLQSHKRTTLSPMHSSIVFVSKVDESKTNIPIDAARHYCGLVSELFGADDEDQSITGGENPEFEVEGVTQKTIEILRDYLIARWEYTSKGTDDTRKQATIPKPLASEDLSLALDAFDLGFVNAWDAETLIELIRLANLVQFKELKALANVKMAAVFMTSTVDEVRNILGLPRDMTDEEEDILRDRHGFPAVVGREDAIAERKKQKAAAQKAAEASAANAATTADGAEQAAAAEDNLTATDGA